MKRINKLVKRVYSKHSVLMLMVWSFVGFYADGSKGLIFAVIIYLVIAPAILYAWSRLKASVKPLYHRQIKG